ncbi:MAG: hypothetical protein R6U37_00455 [Dehalococcoidia bacterium]
MKIITLGAYDYIITIDADAEEMSLYRNLFWGLSEKEKKLTFKELSYIKYNYEREKGTDSQGNTHKKNQFIISFVSRKSEIYQVWATGKHDESLKFAEILQEYTGLNIGSPSSTPVIRGAIICPHCERSTPKRKTLCIHCGQPIHEDIPDQLVEPS